MYKNNMVSRKIRVVVFWTAVFFLHSCSSCDEKKDIGHAMGGVFVSNPSARSCDVLFSQSGSNTSVSVEFSQTVQGQFQSRFPKLSMSFISTSDGPFSGEVVTIFSEDESSSVQIISADCYDKNGVVLENPGVSIK